MKEFDKQIMHFLEDKRKVSIGSAWARGGATSQVVRVEDILPALVDVFRKAPEHPVLAVCLRMWGGHGQADYIISDIRAARALRGTGSAQACCWKLTWAGQNQGIPEGFSVGFSVF